jgi:hypothetical protein
VAATAAGVSHAAANNPGANNPAEIALETSRRDIGRDTCVDIGVEGGTGSGAAVGTTEGSS